MDCNVAFILFLSFNLLYIKYYSFFPTILPFWLINFFPFFFSYYIFPFVFLPVFSKHHLLSTKSARKIYYNDKEFKFQSQSSEHNFWMTLVIILISKLWSGNVNSYFKCCRQIESVKYVNWPHLALSKCKCNILLFFARYWDR